MQVSENYHLCTAAQNQQSTLPSGAIQMAAITPFAGLLKWCILFPVHSFTSQYDGNLSIKNLKNQPKCKDSESLYTMLHFAVTKSLIETGRGTGPPTALCAQHLVSVVPSLQSYIGKLLQIGCILKENTALNVRFYLKKIYFTTFFFVSVVIRPFSPSNTSGTRNTMYVRKHTRSIKSTAITSIKPTTKSRYNTTQRNSYLILYIYFYTK